MRRQIQDTPLMSYFRGETNPDVMQQLCVSQSNAMNCVQWAALQGIRIDPTLLLKEREPWISYGQFMRIQKSIIDRHPGFQMHHFYEIGKVGIDQDNLNFYKALVSLLPYKELIKICTRITDTLARYVKYSLVEYRDGVCMVRAICNEEHNLFSIGGLPQYAAGMYASAIAYRGRQEPAFRVLISQSLIRNVLSVLFQRYALELRDNGDRIMVDGAVLARRIRLDRGASLPRGIEPYREDWTAMAVTRDLVAPDGEVLLHKGEIYDAPFSLFELHWDPRDPPAERDKEEAMRRIDSRMIAGELERQFRITQGTIEEGEGTTNGNGRGVNLDGVLRASGITERERQVIDLLLNGRSKKEIASTLHISVNTAKRHIENIYAKLGIGDRFQLFAMLSKGR